MVAGIDMAGAEDAPRWAVPVARRYILTDRASGEDYEVSAVEVVRIIGVEISYIDWAIAGDGAFENAGWRVR